MSFKRWAYSTPTRKVLLEDLHNADYRSAAHVANVQRLTEHGNGPRGMLPTDGFVATHWDNKAVIVSLSGGQPVESFHPYSTSMNQSYIGPYEQFLREQKYDENGANIRAGWSGRGRHALFTKDYEVQEVLAPDRFLGQGGYSVVQAVKCVAFDGSKVRIAQKIIRTESDDDVKEILKEIKLMDRLKHPHMIQLVGTFLLARKINILMYPVGEDLLTYMTNIEGTAPFGEVQSLIHFIPCLSGALEYLHLNGARHMDLKSANIIVKRMSSTARVYISDFGLSRDFSLCGDSRSSNPIAFTRTYVAPEVAQGQSRGRPADIFSLGAIFSEILTVVASWLGSYILLEGPESDFPVLNLTNFRKYRAIKDEKQTPAFQCNIENVTRWLGFCIRVILHNEDFLKLPISETTLQKMLQKDQSLRPLASDLVVECGSRPCCASNDDLYDRFWPEPNLAGPKPTQETETLVGQLCHVPSEPPFLRGFSDGISPAAETNPSIELSMNTADAGSDFSSGAGDSASTTLNGVDVDYYEGEEDTLFDIHPLSGHGTSCHEII